MIELRPCPFCGSSSNDLIFTHEEDGSCQISCKNCEVSVSGFFIYMENEAQIAEKWNRRFDDEDVLALFNGWLDSERYNCANSEHD